MDQLIKAWVLFVLLFGGCLAGCRILLILFVALLIKVNFYVDVILPELINKCQFLVLGERDR